MAIVETIPERCRRCYTCVRECPAKAIRILDGQASVIADRCIGCGLCYQVCTQNAKRIQSSIKEVRALLAGTDPVTAIVAPSFAAEFAEYDTAHFAAGLRALGFAMVQEVAFGADLVSRAYRDLTSRETSEKTYVATTCPAVYHYVQHYHPELVPNLAPIVSPMIATGRMIKKHWPNTKVVFFGPCVAKKLEAQEDEVKGAIDEVLLFSEVRELFNQSDINPANLEPSFFDEPLGFLGTIFPVPRGSLRAARLDDDPITCRIVEIHGHNQLGPTLDELSEGTLNCNLIEMLACEGCVMGPGMTCDADGFKRRLRVAEFAQERIHKSDMRQWQKNLDKYGNIDLTRSFVPLDSRLQPPSESQLNAVLKRLGKNKHEDELNCGACGYHTCKEHAIAVLNGLAESEMCLPYMVDELEATLRKLEESHQTLHEVQEQLVHSEKLASMGQLAAGIAHEVNNPLGTVLLYSNILLEELNSDDPKRKDVEMVAREADRCKKIISNLLDFARQRKVIAEETDIEGLIEETIESVGIPNEVKLVRQYAPIGPVEVDRSQIKQVFTNLIKNAYEAMPDGGTLTIRSISLDDERIRLEFQDTGTGIDPAIIGKVFSPFFTTKPLGKGTGLGLAVSYGIVKMHRGDIGVLSEVGHGAQFYVVLRRRLNNVTTPVGGQLWQK